MESAPRTHRQRCASKAATFQRDARPLGTVGKNYRPQPTLRLGDSKARVPAAGSGRLRGTLSRGAAHLARPWVSGCAVLPPGPLRHRLRVSATGVASPVQATGADALIWGRLSSLAMYRTITFASATIRAASSVHARLSRRGLRRHAGRRRAVSSVAMDSSRLRCAPPVRSGPSTRAGAHVGANLGSSATVLARYQFLT